MNRLIFFLAGLLLLMTSCQKDKINAKLQGKWQLKTVEQAGTITQVDTVWYNFQSESLFMYQIYYLEKDSFMFRYGYAIRPEEYMLDLELETYAGPLNTFLPYTDWKESKRTFLIEKINGKNLSLSSENKIYHFKKFE